MKKLIKGLLLLTFMAALVYAYKQYPKLSIMTSYSSKMVASAVFVSERTLESIEKCDNNFSPIDLLSNSIDVSSNIATSNLFGMKTDKAIYRKGLGAVVLIDGYSINDVPEIPNRNTKHKNLPFPYGYLPQQDTVFKELNYTKLENIVSENVDENNEIIEGTRALLIIYKDKIIAEKYSSGFNKNSKLLGWSMTKSIVSTMYGIMQKQSIIDINNKVDIKEWQNDERKEITYSNLLQMNSGLAWDEDYTKISDVTKMLYLEADMSLIQAKKQLEGKPNESWNYSSGTANLLSGFLMKSKFGSQQEYLDFWYNELIDKIGMHSMLIETDLSGNFVGSSYAWANTRDWAKYGLLYLHNGNWNGEQIIDSSFVNYSITPTNTSNGGYGAQIWLNKGGTYPDAPKDLYFFNGHQGQRVFVIPSKKMVIVRLGIDNKIKTDFNKLLKDIISTIEEQ